MAISSEFFRPDNAQQEVTDEQDPDDQSEEIGHCQSLSQAWE
jgi:hypothetical protein